MSGAVLSGAALSSLCPMRFLKSRTKWVNPDSNNDMRQPNEYLD